jgi:two-component system, chemotaxis family, chemotaxis protein CheY
MSDTCSVLVVEDETMVREVLAEALNLEGFDVRTAADGRDALTVLERWRPEVILMDVNMPRMDGWAFRAELRRRPDLADIPVIVLSAALWDRDRLVGLDAVELMPKPCDLDVLVGAVRRAAESVKPAAMEALPLLRAEAGNP